MSFSGMIKRKFFKSMQNKINKIVSIFFILECFFSIKKDYMTQHISTDKEEEKGKEIKKIY